MIGDVCRHYWRRLSKEATMQWVRKFCDLTIDDVPQVGGKNASLGEMIRELTVKGIQIPDGYAVTAQAYRAFLHYNLSFDDIFIQKRDLFYKNNCCFSFAYC